MHKICYLVMILLSSCSLNSPEYHPCYEINNEILYRDHSGNSLLINSIAENGVTFDYYSRAGHLPEYYENVVVNSSGFYIENFVYIPRQIVSLDEWSNGGITCHKIGVVTRDLFSFRCRLDYSREDLKIFEFDIRRGIVSISIMTKSFRDENKMNLISNTGLAAPCRD